MWNFLLFGIPGLLFRQNKLTRRNLEEQIKMRRILERAHPRIVRPLPFAVVFLAFIAFITLLLIIVLH
jgi:hypothetical protein